MISKKPPKDKNPLDPARKGRFVTSVEDSRYLIITRPKKAVATIPVKPKDAG